MVVHYLFTVHSMGWMMPADKQIIKETEMNYSEITNFHGHSCPGLAIGYRMAIAAMKKLGVNRSDDEELIAVVENDACGVDALQCVTGCTFGKGNLVFKDYGKPVYTLFSRLKKSGVRVCFHGNAIPEELRENRPDFAKRVLEEQEEAIISVSKINYVELQSAKIKKSVLCSVCGESVMETRLRKSDKGAVCIPCSEAIL